MCDKCCLERLQVDMTVGVFRDHDDVSNRLPPRQFVRVVLERTDEHHRPLTGGNGIDQMVSVVETRRDVDTEHADHEVDRTGGAVAGKDHRMFVGGSDAASNDAAGVLTEPCGLQSGARRLRVGVGIEREDLIPDEVLDELQ